MAKPVERKKVSQDTLRRNEQKWTAALMDAGWMALPTTILDCQQALGLSALDMNILLHILKHWWYKDRLPFPSKKSVAEAIGVHPRTVQKRIAAMEEMGIIRRFERSDPRYGRQSNGYDFSGLIEKVKPFALQEVQARKKRQADSKAKGTRKMSQRARLEVLEGGAGE